MRDILLVILEITYTHAYEVHACFAEDIEKQYGDFKTMQKENSTAQDLYQARSSLGLGVEMFYAEVETFCRTKECLGDILFLCVSDFYTNMYVDNEWQHVWTKEYLDTACRIVDDVKLGQSETDEIVERAIEKVFTESKNIFEGTEEPVFMSKEYAEPFFHLMKTCLKTLSLAKAEILLNGIIKVFSDYADVFESRVK
jgi:hypothetical protein